MVLSKASGFLEENRSLEASALLEPYSKAKCDPRVSLLLAAAREMSGQQAEALNVLSEAHTVWPANTSIASSLAREYMSAGQSAKAVSALENFHAAPSTPLQELQEGVIVYIAGHRLTQAHSLAELTYRRYPTLATLLLFANVLQLEGRYKDVNQILNSQRPSYSNAPNFLITLAESEFDAMLFDGARSDLEHATAIDSKSYQAHYLLGNVFVAQSKIEQAEAEYRAAIALMPNQPRAYYRLALIFRDKQDETSEEAMLTQALSADPRYAPAHSERGRILMSRHQLPGAIAELNLAIQYNPQLEEAYYLLARAYRTSGQKEQADKASKLLANLRAAHRHDPSGATDSWPESSGVVQ